MVLVLDNNPGGALTNSDLEIFALVLHEVTPLEICPEANMAAPRSISDNSPTVSRSMREASTTNPVAADLLCIHTLYLIFFLYSLLFYHHGQENCMADECKYRENPYTSTAVLG